MQESSYNKFWCLLGIVAAQINLTIYNSFNITKQDLLANNLLTNMSVRVHLGAVAFKKNVSLLHFP
jgi:hypothetical protein